MQEDIFQRRPSIRKWLRRNPNGCLEYVGPPRGHSVGNPLISIASDHATTHLRRWIWEKHHGSLPKGMYVRMKCNNIHCHELSHMIISKKHPNGNFYNPKRSEFIVRFSVDKIRTIRYYRGIVSGSLIAQLMGMNGTSVWSLWSSTNNSKISTPEGWHPSLAFDHRVEDASISFVKIYLSPGSLRNAKEDIKSSHLSPRHKELVTRMIEGEKASSIAKKLKLSNMGVLYLFRRSLLNIYRELGDRRWIHLASKGRIRRWNETSNR